MKTKIKGHVPCEDKSQNVVSPHCIPAPTALQVIDPQDKGKDSPVCR